MQDELTQTIGFLQRLNAMTTEERDALIAQRSALFIDLYKEMGALITADCGNLNKLYERVVQLEMQQQKDSEVVYVQHVRHGYGADINIVRGAGVVLRVECKNSMTKQKNNYTTSWNFSLPVSLELTNREAMFVALAKKLGDGYVTLRAMHATEVLNEYRLSNTFMALFLARRAFTNQKKNINLGRQRCATCKEYHFILRLVELDTILNEAIRDGNAAPHTCLTEKQWSGVENSVSTQCKAMSVYRLVNKK